jgi:hypothetical protein
MAGPDNVRRVAGTPSARSEPSPLSRRTPARGLVRVKKRSAGAAAAIALAAITQAAPAARADGAAPSSRLSLEWSAPASCPSAADVRKAVDRLLGEKGGDGAQPIRVSAIVSQEESGGFYMKIEAPGEGSARARELRGPTCAAVTDAAALIIALMFDPSAMDKSAREGAPPSPPPPSPLVDGSSAAPDGPTPAPAPAPTAPEAKLGAGRAPTPSPRRARRASPPDPRSDPAAPTLISIRASVFGGADLGSLPAIAGSIGGALAIHVGPQRYEAGFNGWPARASRLPSQPSAGGDVDLFAFYGAACRVFRAGPIRLAPCGALEIGQIHASGFGVPRLGSGSSVWFALKLGPLAFWELWSHVGLTARLEAVVPFLRPEFVLQGPRLVHQPLPVSGRASAGVELRF